MDISHSKSFFKITTGIIVIGYSLCLGSIASFIAMNIIAGDSPTIEFLYWQRTFVNSIMNYVTAPAIWLFLLGNIGLFLTLGKERNRKNVILLMLSILVVINGQLIIIPFAKTVSSLAVQQLQISQFIPNFAANKAIEDTCGEINLLFLITYLTVYILNTSKLVVQTKSIS
ncbi:MAG TPA: hypothetical protein DIC46_09420 [Porphyromonadaceae bacterium]|jgi:uncharacterized membrane protein|nr:hypothetical protein [Porphyromonadaceae bacterium]